MGESRWNPIVRVTLVMLGSPGRLAGESPALFVLRGLALAHVGLMVAERAIRLAGGRS
jgi:hypothetical protein